MFDPESVAREFQQTGNEILLSMLPLFIAAIVLLIGVYVIVTIFRNK